MTDKGIALIASHLHNLEALCLAHCAVTDSAFTVLGEGCKNLRHLFITSEKLTDKAIENFGVAGGSNLIRLDVSGCIQLTDEFVQLVSLYYPNLEDLTFQYCREVTSKCAQLFQKLPKLATLKFWGTVLQWYHVDELLPDVQPHDDGTPFWNS